MGDSKLTALTSMIASDFDLTEELYGNDGGTSKRVTVAEIRKALGLYSARLASDDSKTSTTAAKVTGLDLALPVGSFAFEYYLRYTTAATGTGIAFGVNFSGTVTSFVRFHQQYYRDGPFEVPYAVAEVTLEEGPRLYAQLVDVEPELGLAVEVCFEDLGPGLTVARFRRAEPR